MDTHLAHHLLWRLRHRAEADAIDHAVERGILVEDLRTAEGRKVRTFVPGPAVAGKSEAEITRLLQHGASVGSRRDRAADDEYGIAMDALQASSGRDGKGLPPDNATAQSRALPLREVVGAPTIRLARIPEPVPRWKRVGCGLTFLTFKLSVPRGPSPAARGSHPAAAPPPRDRPACDA